MAKMSVEEFRITCKEGHGICPQLEEAWKLAYNWREIHDMKVDIFGKAADEMRERQRDSDVLFEKIRDFYVAFELEIPPELANYFAKYGYLIEDI
jgi:hypothetical protein